MIKELAKLACGFARSIVESSATSPGFNQKDYAERVKCLKTYDQFPCSRYFSLHRNKFFMGKKTYNTLNVIYNACFAYETSYGNCAELSHLALLYITKYLDMWNLHEEIIATIWGFNGEDHSIVVIKRKNSNNIEDNYVCDALLKSCYPLSEIYYKGRGYRSDTTLFLNYYNHLSIKTCKNVIDSKSTGDVFPSGSTEDISKCCISGDNPDRNTLEEAVNHCLKSLNFWTQQECCIVKKHIPMLFQQNNWFCKCLNYKDLKHTFVAHVLKQYGCKI